MAAHGRDGEAPIAQDGDVARPPRRGDAPRGLDLRRGLFWLNHRFGLRVRFRLGIDLGLRYGLQPRLRCLAERLDRCRIGGLKPDRFGEGLDRFIIFFERQRLAAAGHHPVEIALALGILGGASGESGSTVGFL